MTLSLVLLAACNDDATSPGGGGSGGGAGAATETGGAPVGGAGQSVGGRGEGGALEGGASDGGADQGGRGEGGEGAGITCTPESDFSGPPLDTAEDTWEWVEVAGATCRDGSPAGFGVRRSTTSDRVVIYLEGGGACFNGESCLANPAAFGAADFATWASGGSGIFDVDGRHFGPRKRVLPDLGQRCCFANPRVAAPLGNTIGADEEHACLLSPGV